MWYKPKKVEKLALNYSQFKAAAYKCGCMVHQIKIFIKTTEMIYDFAFVLSLQLINSLSRQRWGMSALCYMKLNN